MHYPSVKLPAQSPQSPEQLKLYITPKKKKTLNHKLNQILNLQPKYIHNQEEGVPADDVDRTERSNLRLRFDLENGKEREFWSETILLESQGKRRRRRGECGIVMLAENAMAGKKEREWEWYFSIQVSVFFLFVFRTTQNCNACLLDWNSSEDHSRLLALLVGYFWLWTKWSDDQD